MTRNRLEAFSDGVLAIIITIMVLELRVPEGGHWGDIEPLFPVFLAYVLSFVHLGIYWNNHHHMLHLADRINGKVLWANLHLLFWLSLFPFVTAWMGENDFERGPIILYGAVSLMAGFAYFVLKTMIIKVDGADSKLGAAIGGDLKGRLSILIYVMAIAGAFVTRWISLTLYVLVAVMWLIPDRRIESTIEA